MRTEIAICAIDADGKAIIIDPSTSANNNDLPMSFRVI